MKWNKGCLYHAVVYISSYGQHSQTEIRGCNSLSLNIDFVHKNSSLPEKHLISLVTCLDKIEINYVYSWIRGRLLQMNKIFLAGVSQQTWRVG